MSLVLLLEELAARQIELCVEDGRLRYKAPKGVLTPQLRQRIKAEKGALVAHLCGHSQPEPEILRTVPSPAQERLWFVDQMLGPNFTYNIPMALRLRGDLDGAALRAALDDMVRRHQSLRCSFRHDGDSLSLEIVRDLRAPWIELDISGTDEATRRSRLGECADSIARHCFDLSRAPLMLASLLRLGTEEHVLILNFHHIVTDGWSFGIIMQELAAGYQARRAGRAAALPPLRWHYTDYIEWQQQLRLSGAMDADLAFWRERMAGAPACTTMPADKRRLPVQDFAGCSVPLIIDAEKTARLRAKAREWGASLSHLTLAAMAVLLSDFSASRDLVIGLPLANRTRRELEPMIGMFVNVVPLRINVSPHARPSELVAQVKRASTEAMEHCNLPFERLVEELVLERDLSMNPVFQVAYNFLPPMQLRSSFAGLEVDSPNVFGDAAVSKYDCTFYFDEQDGSITGHIEYASHLYRRDTGQRWVQAYVAILTMMLENGDAPLDARFRVGPAERGQLEAQCTGPVVPLPEGSPWARFEAVAAERPDDVAVAEGDDHTSYAELARRAGIVSAKLEALGVGKGDRVGLMLPRGCDYLAAMLGVVHRGAVFVPLDHAQPIARLTRMAAQAPLGAVVCHVGDATASVLATEKAEIGVATWSENRAVPNATHLSHDDPLYIIFTSGTTGAPKAVCVPWRGLCNVVQGFVRTFGLASRERVSQIASPGFDASLFEMWPSLLSGCTLVFVPDDLKLDPRALRDFLLKERISVHFSPTPLAEALLDLEWPASAPLRLMTTGGQTLHKHPRPGLPFQLSNNYGPTETSIVATWGLVEPELKGADQPTLGRAIDNTRVGVYDESGRGVPVGTVGELYVSGVGVALEYLGDSEATAHSFVTLPGEPSLRWYRTGDNVRLQPDGALEFVGRLDKQIKLRGYRIEPGEVESALLGIVGVRQAAVRLEGEHLAAYLEVREQGVNPELIRRQLSMVLPAHMIPSSFVILATLPRQSSGKIDIGAISFVQEAAAAAAPAPAATAPTGSRTQSAIARAWARVLGRHAPGLNDSFFDLGGHSLMLVRLKEQIRAETGCEIGVLDLFRNPTIARQAAFVDGGTAPKSDAPRAPSGPPSGGGIAIIGMAGRFPEADSVEAFWKNLRDGRDCIHMCSRQELLEAGVPVDRIDSPNYVPANAILRGIDRFDAEFFSISTREAEVMDPQQRLLLEEAWHVFEDAGYDPARIEERVGVFVGSSFNGYLVENVLPRSDLVESLGGFAIMIHNDKDFAATRLSYKLDLRGPSVSVNTACSTSLVAVHQAVTALRDGQCELALAGGACVRSRQIDGYRYEDGGVLSRDGKCRAFDATATGMVGGNGVALVLLKPLVKAIADHDHIYAVIKGIAANNDGADKMGFAAPGMRGQTLVIRDALERAEVDPQTVGYVEAHGTGTQLGDAIEVTALAESYAPNGSRALPLQLGSVKTNVGHLDAAAGATGLIKTALCLHERMLVPSLHFQTPNPQIHWPGGSISVCTHTAPWKSDGTPLRAAVSSLGIGGTNAHAVLEAAPARTDGAIANDGAPKLLLLSGRSERVLQSNAALLADWLGEHPEARMGDVAHTLAFGRRHWENRRVVCASGAEQAAELLTEPHTAVDRAQAVAFMFTGMGTHKPGMARALYGRAPAFTACIDESAGLLRPVLGLDIRTLLLAAPDDEAASALLNQHRVGQPSVFALEYALARFWMDLGISPSVLIGHSLGEWTAACVAGVFSLPDALRLVSLRGGLMEDQSEGAMLAVNLTESDMAAHLPAGLDVATINASDEIVVAGPAKAVEAFALQLEADQVRCKRLRMKVAAHSSLMDPARAPLVAAIANVPRSAPDPSMAVISNITGLPLEPEQLRSPDYWGAHLRQSVRFVNGLGAMWAQARLALLECGPSHTLCNIALRDARRLDARAIVATLDGDDNPDAEWRRALESAGTLWTAGLPIDLNRLFALQGRGLRIPLPGYAFQRKRYWLDAVPAQTATPRLETAAAETSDDVSVSISPSASPAEQRVVAIMQELLGPVHLSHNSDFFLCGGDSLLAVRLASRIGEVFGVPATRAQVMRSRTPAKIAALLENGGAHEDVLDKIDDCLTRLSTGNDKLPPIVLVHAVGGGIFIYRELLLALSTAHPVFGLQAPGLWDSGAPIDDLRKQAELYHACLLRAGIRSPIMIAGSSYGGLVCYELDRLYRELGHSPPLVVLFDSPGPGHMPARLESEAEICAYLLSRDVPGRDFAVDLAQMEALDHEGRLALLLDYMRKSVMPGAAAEDVERQLRVFRQNLVNMWNWVPQPHDARLLFCKATEGASLLASNPELAWLPLAGGGIEILPAPGNHSSMLSFPHVNFLARELNRRLSASAID